MGRGSVSAPGVRTLKKQMAAQLAKRKPCSSRIDQNKPKVKKTDKNKKQKHADLMEQNETGAFFFRPDRE